MGYRVPNQLPEDFTEIEWTLISMVRFLDSEAESVTCSSPYNIAVPEQSCNMSPWENDHKSQLVKPILMKPIVLDEGHVRLHHYEISDTEEH